MRHRNVHRTRRMAASIGACLLLPIPSVLAQTAPPADGPDATADSGAAGTGAAAASAPAPLRGYGGKAASDHFVRQIRDEQLEAERKRPRTGETLQDWLDGSSVLGDWGGLRPELADQGISFGGFSANAFQTNATGGNRRSWAWANLTLAETDLDFGRLAGLDGFSIRAQMAVAGGNNLSSASRIGNLFNVATEYTPNGVYLSQLYAQQRLFDDALTVQIGRLTTTTNFGTLPVFTDYVSVAGNGTPTAIPIGSTYFSFPPAVEWGAVATVAPTKTLTVAAGVYNSNNSSAGPQASANGTDFGLTFDNGALTVAQVTWTPDRADPGVCPPGIFSFGGFYASGNYPRLTNGKEKEGNYGIYGMAQQMVYQEEGTDGSQGLTPWLAFAWNPEEVADFLPFWFAGGAVYRGLVPQRDADTTAIAVYTGKFSQFVPKVTNETVLEVNYTMWATPWLGVTPDFQYVFHPMGGSSKNDAAVFGGQIMLVF